MSNGQHTSDWNRRFCEGDTPWEDAAVAPAVADLFAEHAPQPTSVIELGCGLGTTSLWLARQGYRVRACDISPEAIRVARERAAAGSVGVDFVVADALRSRADLGRAEVVFTRGVLHTFTDSAGRSALAAAVADLLPARGLWLDVSGSADTPNDPPDVANRGWPRLTLAEIALAVESGFEVIAVRQTAYGTTSGLTDFAAFASAFRRRGP